MKINNNKIKSLFLLSLVGSGLTKEEKSNNQTGIVSDGIKLNSLPQIATNLTKREDNPNATLMFAGYPMTMTVGTVSGDFTKYCTTNFVVVNTNSSECRSDSGDWSGNDYGGFLASPFCWPSEQAAGTLLPEIFSWDGLTFLGMNRYISIDSDYSYTSSSGTSIYIRKGIQANLQLIPYVLGESNNTPSGFDFYPVTGLGSATIGSEVCAYGVGSGYVCGNVTQFNEDIAIADPWNPVNMENDHINFIIINGLNKVDLGVNGLYSKGDLGGPVYTLSSIGNRTIAQALGHITYFDNSDPNHKLLYYTPIDKVLNGIGGDYNCSYALMTHNETHAEKYQELLAQVEIPAKK